MSAAHLTGKEIILDDDTLIVSKTDPHGRITYVNRTFIEISRYPEIRLLGAQHSVIRHPDMPRCVFKLLWDSVTAGREIFAYVVNRASDGDHYWVVAHVTPSFSEDNRIIGYHSNRRKADPPSIARIEAIYGDLARIERQAADSKLGLRQSFQALTDMLANKGMEYDEFVLSL